ncbi:MAG TPA: hypothetical protein VIC28_05490 [Thermoanaerobaculia bacterium]
MSLPAGARRLFPHYDEADLDRDRAGSLLIARLLEDGDAADLAWLLGAAGEPAVADWFAGHGGRQLSRRSRAFWEIVLGRPASPVRPEAGSLWPL